MTLCVLGAMAIGNAQQRTATLPADRRRLIARRLREQGSVSVASLESEFGVSGMTARRDLAALEREGRATRTYGGAVAPGLAGHEDSFATRAESEVAAKEALAAAAAAMVQPGQAVFLDSSTTAYVTARRILAGGAPVTVVTNSLPIMSLFAAGEPPPAELVAVGGSLRKLTLSYVGPDSVRAIRGHLADLAFFSVKGVSEDGRLSDPDPLEAEVKRAMVEQAERAVLLVDGTKVGRRGLSLICPPERLGAVIAADVPEPALAALARGGADVHRVPRVAT